MNLIKLLNRDSGLEVRLWTAIYRRLLGGLGPRSIISKADQILNPRRIPFSAWEWGSHIARGWMQSAEQRLAGPTRARSTSVMAPPSNRIRTSPRASTLRIGAYVLTGSRIFITDHNHGLADLDHPVAYQPLDVAPVTVQDYAWLEKML